MEFKKHEKNRSYNLFDVIADIHSTTNEQEYTRKLDALRVIHADAVAAANFITNAHAHAIRLSSAITSESTRDEIRRANTASEVAAFAGLDTVCVKNVYRNSKTSGKVFILDQLQSMYTSESVEGKAKLDDFYSRIYGATCAELITQVNEKREPHLQIKIDHKKAATVAIGAATIGAITLGTSPASADIGGMQLATSIHPFEQSISIPFEEPELDFESMIKNGDVAVTQPDGPVEGFDIEVPLTPIEPSDPSDDTDLIDTESPNIIELDPIELTPGEAGTDPSQDEPNTIVTPAPGQEPETEPETAPEVEQTPAPSQEPEQAPAEPGNSEQETTPEKPKTAKPAPKEGKKDTPKSSESAKEKENEAYRVFTDYVHDKTASLAGNSRWHPMDADKLIKLIDKYYDKYKDQNNGVIDREYIAAVLYQESKFDPRASSGVADGIGQFTAGTVDFVGQHINFNDPWDPEQSVEATFWYYNYIYKKFDNYSKSNNWPKSKNTVEHKLEMALAGYNSGPNARIFKNGNMPNYAETNDYRRIIMGDYHDMKQAQDKILGDTSSKAPASSGSASSAGRTEKQAPKPETEKKPLKIVGFALGGGEGHELTYYNQWEQPWADLPYHYPGGSGNVDACGCGAVSAATAFNLVGNVGKVTPKDTSKRFMELGVHSSASYCGSNHIWEDGTASQKALEKEYNVEIHRISLTDKAFKEVIDAGGFVLMSQGQGIFTSGGHIMLVTGYNNRKNIDGGDHKYIVADSNSRQKTSDLEGFSPSILIGNGKPDTKAGRSGVGGTRGYAKGAWAIMPTGEKAKTTSQETPKPKAETAVHKKKAAKPSTKSQKPKTKIVPPANIEPITPEPTPEAPTEPELTPTPAPEPEVEAPAPTEPPVEAPSIDELLNSVDDEVEVIQLEPISPFAADIETSNDTPVEDTLSIEQKAIETPDTLVEGESVQIRDHFNPNLVVSHAPTLTKSQLQNLKKY